MKRLMGLLAALALGFSLAQVGPPNLSPEMRQRLEAYRPVFDLVCTIGLMDEVEKQRGLAFTKAQATRLLPILRDLQTRANLKPTDAEKILTNIENNILTPQPSSRGWIRPSCSAAKKPADAGSKEADRTHRPARGTSRGNRAHAEALSRPFCRESPTTPSRNSPALPMSSET